MPLLCSYCFRSDLIDPKMEQAVSRMQTAIELGRLVRDQKVIPIKVSSSNWSLLTDFDVRFLMFPPCL